MKPALLLLISIAFASCAKKHNDLISNNIKGNVRQITENVFEVNEKFGDLQKGKLKTTNVIKYNEDGNVTEYRRISMPDSISGKEDNVETYQYKDGKKISSTNGKSHKIDVRYAYDNDKLVEINTYKDNGSLSMKTKFKYNNNDLIAEADEYVSNGNLNGRVINKYTDSKHIKEQDKITADNKIESVTWYNYDEKDNLTGYKYKSGTYTGNYLLNFSNLEKDNWLKLVNYYNGKPETLVERKIEYYN